MPSGEVCSGEWEVPLSPRQSPCSKEVSLCNLARPQLGGASCEAGEVPPGVPVSGDIGSWHAWSGGVPSTLSILVLWSVLMCEIVKVHGWTANVEDRDSQVAVLLVQRFERSSLEIVASILLSSSSPLLYHVPSCAAICMCEGQHQAALLGA